MELIGKPYKRYDLRPVPGGGGNSKAERRARRAGGDGPLMRAPGQSDADWATAKAAHIASGGITFDPKPKTPDQHVADVKNMLREEFGSASETVGIWNIPSDRLKQALDQAVASGASDVTVKIPSHSEFTMTVPQAKAVHAVVSKG
jgi:hypothetical protein